MRRQFPRMMLLSLLCGCLLTASAQQPDEKVTLHFKVWYVMVQSDSILVFIQGNPPGLTRGMSGRCVQTWQTGKNRDDNRIGDAIVSYVKKDTALCQVKLYNTGSAADSVHIGDLLSFEMPVSRKSERSIFFDLQAMQIRFVDLNKQPFYTLTGLLARDGKQNEDSLLEKMRKDVLETYETVKDMFDETSDLKKPLTKGRYLNRTVLDVMKKATKKDILDFLYFVKSYPGKYMGNEFKVSETFATWVLNLAPISSYELRAQLWPLRNKPAELARTATQLAKEIREEELLKTISDEAIPVISREEFDKAEPIIRFAASVGKFARDTAGLARLYLIWAQLEQDRGNYEKAILLCDTAIHYAALSAEHDYELQSHFKKVFCLYKLLRFETAKKAVVVANTRLEQLAPLLDKELYQKNRSKSFQYSGWVNYEAGEYNDAIENLGRATEITRRYNTFDAWRDVALNQNYIALSYREQGNYRQARVYYDSAFSLYRLLNDESSTAILANSIGYLYFKMGDYDSSMYYHERAYQKLVELKNYSNAGYAKSQIAQCLWNKGDYAKAITTHKEAIGWRRQGNDRSGEAFSWEMLGSLYKLTGDKSQALLAYDSAAFYYGVARDSTGIIKSLNYVGEVYKNDKNYKRAIEYYEKAMQLATRLNRKAQLIDAYFNIADASFTYDTLKSRTYYEKCMGLARTTGDRVNEFYSLVNLGVLSNRQYNFPTGKRYFNEALALSPFIENRKDIAYCYSRIGDGLIYELDFARSDEQYQRAYAVYDSVGSASDMGYQALNLGSNAVSTGQFDKTVNYYNQALRLADSSSNTQLKGTTYNAFAYLYQLQGDVDKGQVFNDSAIAVFRRTGNNGQLADAMLTHGILMNARNDFAGAITAYQSADSLYAAEKMEDSRTTVVNNIGNIYYFQADYKKALAYFQQAEKKLRPGIIDELYLIVKSNIAECYFYLGDLQKARTELERLYPLAANKSANRMLASLSLVLGKVYLGMNDQVSAMQYLKRAEEYARKTGEVEAWADAGMYLGKSLLANRQEDEGVRYLRNTVAVIETYNLNKQGWESLYELGLYFYNRKQLDSAVVYFKKAVDRVEKNASRLFGGDAARKIYEADTRKVDLYNKIIASLATLKRNEEAWLYANRSNNAALKEKLGVASATDPAKSKAIEGANKLLQQQSALDKSISDLQAGANASQNEEKVKALQKKKAVLEKDYLNYVSSLVEQYPDLDAYFAKNVNPEDLKRYKDKLPADLAVLLYLINDRQLYVFTVTNENIGITVSDLPDSIQGMISNYEALLNLPEKASGTGTLTLRSNILREKKPKNGLSFTETSEQLYHVLMDDIKPAIAGKKKLCIVPNGKLSNIPFQCLGMRMPDSTFRFLVEDYCIFYTNKLDIFLESKAVSTDNIGSLIAFGNPDRSLPSAEEEVKEINKIIRTANVYTQQNATESRARQSLESNKYVHFATHGVLDYTDFKKSYLKFVRDNGSEEDGNLTISEIKSLAINGCELVTLSACETAVSRELTKGWYVSPANSFLINRVKTVVASLWSVDDAATSILMKEFYRNLQTMEKADALRAAQQTLSRDPRYVHPFYWGAFVLYGDWR